MPLGQPDWRSLDSLNLDQSHSWPSVKPCAGASRYAASASDSLLVRRSAASRSATGNEEAHIDEMTLNAEKHDAFQNVSFCNKKYNSCLRNAMSNNQKVFNSSRFLSTSSNSHISNRFAPLATESDDNGQEEEEDTFRHQNPATDASPGTNKRIYLKVRFCYKENKFKPDLPPGRTKVVSML